MTHTPGLRSIVEALDREMARVEASGGAAGADTAALLSLWARLVERFALTLPAALRACPSCGGIGARAATRCDRCGHRLAPPAPEASA